MFRPPMLAIFSVAAKTSKAKVKEIPLHAWSVPEGSSKLSSADFMTTAQDGGNFVSLKHRPPLHPAKVPGTHFC